MFSWKVVDCPYADLEHDWWAGQRCMGTYERLRMSSES
jgi:hypothetical protein